MPLPATLSFVDLETTGATATSDRITEIGIVEVDADGVREWSSLVNPGTAIPPFIESLTGISNAMVRDAPRFAELAPALAERLAGRVFVAHNARFDYGFLKNEFKRVGIDFRAQVLCTVKLSRKLYPQFHKHSLDALVERHALAVDGRHRALADARLIHQFWSLLPQQFADTDIAAAVDVQILRPSLPPHLDPHVLDTLPEGHGVYLFYAENDLPLYVGKSNTLRRRVLAHFAADHANAKEMSLAQQVRRIEVIETGGETGALIHEALLVKRLQPTHNHRLRRNDELCSWRFLPGGSSAAPPLQLADVHDAGFGGDDMQFGLFRNAREAKRVIKELAAETGLCLGRLGIEKLADGKPCFGHQIRKCAGVCVGRESAATHDARLAAALARLHVESWPWPGPAFVREGAALLLFDRWRYLGTAHDADALFALLDATPSAFDADIYRIALRARQRLRPLPRDPASLFGED